MPQFQYPEQAALAALVADTIANCHGEGALLRDNRPEGIEAQSPEWDAWNESKDRLELWAIEVDLPGTVNVTMTVFYFAATNHALGTFAYSFYKPLDKNDLESVASETWMYWSETFQQAKTWLANP